MSNTINNIQLNLKDVNKVYGNHSELAEGLKNRSNSTFDFIKAIGDFLIEFNDKYETNVDFEQVLDIYDGKSNLDMNQSIILCKALLEFVQNNGIEISFKNKSYLLKYNTLSSVNATLEYDPISDDDIDCLKILSVTISSFIKKIRQYFRILINDSVSLDEANVDEHFKNITGKKLNNKCSIDGANVEVSDVNIYKDEVKTNNNKNDIQISANSVKVCEGFVIENNITDVELIDRITNLSNEVLISFLNFIYFNIDSRKSKKHIEITKFLFNDYTISKVNSVKRVLEGESTFRRHTVTKINLKKVRKLIFGESFQVKNDNVKGDVYIEGNIMHLGKGVELNLEDDEIFVNNLVGLSPENVRKVFFYMENIVITRKMPGDTTASILAGIIQKSPDRSINIRQKISSLRSKVSGIQKKFIDSNINVKALRELILLGKGDTTDDEKNIGNEGSMDLNSGVEKNYKTYDYVINEGEEEQEIIKVELNGNKDIKGFIFSLNSFVIQYCKNQDMEGYVEEFTFKDFNGYNLDMELFTSIYRNGTKGNFSELADMFDKEYLDTFLKNWFSINQIKIKEVNKIHIETGSEEELWDFVFNVWQPALYKKVRQQARKGNKKNNDISMRRKKVTLTKEMFEGVNKLSLDLFDNVKNLHNFSGIFSDINTPKSEVIEMIREYKKERLLESMMG